jgi:hypothetical protein
MDEPVNRVSINYRRCCELPGLLAAAAAVAVSFFAAKDQLYIEIHMSQTVKKFGRLFRSPTLVGDFLCRLKTVRPSAGGQNLHLPATLSPSISLCARQLSLGCFKDSF